MTTGEPALRTIAAIDPKPGYRLEIVWAGGDTSVVDLSSDIAIGGVFAPLKDPVLFDRVRIGMRRRTIEWPEPIDAEGAPTIDIDADALLAMSLSDRTVSAAAKAQRQAR